MNVIRLCDCGREVATRVGLCRPCFDAYYTFIDATCPSCGAELKAQYHEPWTLPNGEPGPTVFAHYPHRAKKWKGWCNKGTWTQDPPLTLPGVA